MNQSQISESNHSETLTLGAQNHQKFINKLYRNSDSYKEYFKIPEEELNKISNHIVNRFQKKSEKDEINILLAGVGSGRIEISILKKLLDEGYEINLFACDLSEMMLTSFLKQINHLIDEGAKLHVKRVDNSDIISFLNSFNSEAQFDLITCFFVVHMVPYWEKVLDLLFRISSNSTQIWFSEEVGDACWIDNAFERHFEKNHTSDDRNNIRKFWKSYHDFRIRELQKPWQPVISASNIDIVRECFDVLFRENSESEEFTWKIDTDKNFFKKIFSNKLSENIYYPLEYALTDSEKDDSEKEFYIKNLPSFDDCYERKEGLKLIQFNGKEGLSPQKANVIISSTFTHSLLRHFSTSNHSYLWEDDNVKSYFTTLWKLYLRAFQPYKTQINYYLWEPDPFHIHEGQFIDKLPFALINFHTDEKEIAKYLLSYLLYGKLREEEFFILGSLLRDFPNIFSLNIEFGCTKLEVDWRIRNDSSHLINVHLPQIFNAENSQIIQEICEDDQKLEKINQELKPNDDFKYFNLQFQDLTNKIKIEHDKNLEEIFTPEIEKIIEELSGKLNDIFDEIKLVQGWKDSPEVKQLAKAIITLDIIGYGTKSLKLRRCIFASGKAVEIFDEEKQSKELGFGGIILLCPKQEFDFDETKDFFLDKIPFFLSTVNTFTRSDGIKIYSDVSVEKARELSIKSAVSAIMSRNMSHNIGSHVLASLVNERDRFIDTKMKKFLRYIQIRMEFIADIITTEAAITFTTNLKNDVIDHFFSEKPNHNFPEYLLRYISGTKEIYFDLEPPDVIKNLKIELKNDNTLIALPNDILGAQALYVILENIIRNATKHSIIPGSGDNKLLHLKIQKESNFEDNDLIKYTIWDNLGKSNSDFRGRNNFEIIEDGEEKKVEFEPWIQYKIDRPILEKQGKLRQNDWGMLEMKICAAYLRKHHLEKIDHDPQNTPLLKVNVNKSTLNMGYELYLLKPKLACVIVRDKSKIEKKEEIKNLGVEVFSVSEIDREYLETYGLIKKNYLESHKTSHTFLIIENNIALKPKNNQPLISTNLKEINSLLESTDKNEIHLAILQKLSANRELKNLKKVDEKCNLEELEQKLIFDDHGKCKEKNKGNWPENIFYYEPYGSQAPTNQLLKKYDQLTGIEKDILKYELNFAATLKVGILDERIQRKTEFECNYTQQPIRQTLEGMNIHIPATQDIDLDVNSYCDDLKNDINNWMLDHKSKYEYILVHQGIIEKTVGSTDSKSIEAKFIQKFNDSKAKIIIISGRGKPSNLPENIYYLPYSLVNQYLIPYRSKLYLYKLLISSRRYRHG